MAPALSVNQLLGLFIEISNMSKTGYHVPCSHVYDLQKHN